MFNKFINKFKNYHPAKPLMLLYFLIPIIIALIVDYEIDNDFYFLSSIGKYIVNNSIPYFEPFSIHSGFSYVAQQWLSGLIFYFIYNTFGYVGSIIFVYIMFFVIIYLFYKLCLLVSEKRVGLSVIITTITMSLLATFFVRTRPQMFDYIIFLLEFYILEKYIRDDKSKGIYILPILSLLLINLHASSWFMLFIFMLPYIINSFKFKFLCFESNGYRLKPIIIVILLMVLMGFINPYGIDSITYIFKSYNVKYINIIVNEMHMPSIKDFTGIVIYISIISVLLIYLLVNKKTINIKSFLLYIGTSILAMSSVKGFSFFLIGGVFSVTEYLKEKFLVYKDNYNYSIKFKIEYVLIIIIFIFLSTIFMIYNKDNVNKVNIKSITSYIKKDSNNIDNIKVYCDYDNGSYLIFNDLKVYIDPRAEVYLKSNNKKEDIMKEFYRLQRGYIDSEKFIEKYNFDYIIVNEKDYLYRNYLYKDISHKYKKVYGMERTNNTTYFLYKKIK